MEQNRSQQRICNDEGKLRRFATRGRLRRAYDVRVPAGVLLEWSTGRRTQMRFRILGPLEISDDLGQPVAITRPLHRSALALLLLNAGQPCSTRNLAAGLWGDTPPLSPEVSLRSCVYGIRKALPDAGRLRTHPSGYLIAVRPGELDLDNFRDLVTRGRQELDSDCPRSAAMLLSQAVGLWREPVLADMPTVPARVRLLGQLKEAQDALTDARLAAGEHRQVLADLRGIVAADPLHEHAW